MGQFPFKGISMMHQSGSKVEALHLRPHLVTLQLNYLDIISIILEWYSQQNGNCFVRKKLSKCFYTCPLVVNTDYQPPALQSGLMFIHITLISGKLHVHFCAMASSPLGRMRLKGSPPTPVNPRPTLGSRAVSSVLAEEA